MYVSYQQRTRTRKSIGESQHLRATFYDIERSYNTVQLFLLKFFQ